MNMNINSYNRANINFGWSCETHKQIMDTALNDFPEFELYRDKFNHFVQQPDHDDIGFMANKHFYFGEDKLDLSTKKEEKKEEEKTDNNVVSKFMTTATSNGIAKVFTKVFNTNSASFLDYSGENNAKAAYDHHVNEIYNSIEDEDGESAIENTARAAHFLQDMTQPQHAENTTAWGKATDFKTHTDFENYVTSKNADLTQNYYRDAYKGNAPAKKSFTELFDETYHKTKGFEKIKSGDKKQWDEISQAEFNNAVEGTRSMLRNLSKLLNLS